MLRPTLPSDKSGFSMDGAHGRCTPAQARSTTLALLERAILVSRHNFPTANRQPRDHYPDAFPLGRGNDHPVKLFFSLIHQRHRRRQKAKRTTLSLLASSSTELGMPTHLWLSVRWHDRGLWAGRFQLCPVHADCTWRVPESSALPPDRWHCAADLCYDPLVHSMPLLLEIRRVKKKGQEHGQEKLSNAANRTTAAIDLDFEDFLMMGILDSVLRSKAKRRKPTKRLTKS